MHPLLRLGLLAVSLAVPAKAGWLDWLLPKHDIQVITVTDTTPAGALRRLPSPQAPIYYVAASAGFRDFGGIVAGEKEPPKEQVYETIAKVLGARGYLPATQQNPPSLLLMWTWGTMNTDRIFTGNPDDVEGRQINRRQLMRFMGAYKLGLISKEPTGWTDDLTMGGLSFRDADQDLIYDLASEDLYVAAIAAYDYPALTRKQKVLLWTTKISCPSRGLALPETLPVMLTIAGPNIGRETERPVAVRASEKFRAEVKIGDPTVVEQFDGSLPVVELPAGKAGAKPNPKSPGPKRN